MSYSFLFHLMPYSGMPDNTPYQHTSIALAEGLSQLGFTFYATCRYWFDREQNCFLFEQQPEGFIAPVHVYSVDYVKSQRPRLSKGTINVLIDDADGWQTPSIDTQFADFDLILRAHYNADFAYLPTVRPWAFGLTDRLIHYNNNYRNHEVARRIYANTRVAQNVRTLANERLMPLLGKHYEIYTGVTDSLVTTRIEGLEETDYWNQTGRRHNQAYYELLNTSLLTFAFGGISEYRPVGSKATGQQSMARVLAKLSKLLKLPEKPFYCIHNFDNWRFWEALVSNTCPVALDFHYWNCQYPVMPVAGTHYIGVKDFDFEATAQQLLELPGAEIRKIAENGRHWALQEYNPVATAKRFMALLGTPASRTHDQKMNSSAHPHA